MSRQILVKFSFTKFN